MLNLVLVDKAKQIITLEDNILSIQTQRGKILLSDTMSKYKILFMDEEHKKLVLQCPPKKSFGFVFDDIQEEEFQHLCSILIEKCEYKDYGSFNKAMYAKEETEMQKKVRELSVQRDDSNIVNMVDKNQARCPRCGSTSLSANKKGFGMGKAVVGTLAFGVIGGALAGSVGAKKIEVTCLKCGKRFKV